MLHRCLKHKKLCTNASAPSTGCIFFVFEMCKCNSVRSVLCTRKQLEVGQYVFVVALKHLWKCYNINNLLKFCNIRGHSISGVWGALYSRYWSVLMTSRRALSGGTLEFHCRPCIIQNNLSIACTWRHHNAFLWPTSSFFSAPKDWSSR